MRLRELNDLRSDVHDSLFRLSTTSDCSLSHQLNDLGDVQHVARIQEAALMRPVPPLPPAQQQLPTPSSSSSSSAPQNHHDKRREYTASK